ncbi:hypothetical protein AAT19DRAFT_16830 [Rhodotorula toruloides]|uniref:Uncharacterized protein n=1 Tax=Rhodotorula toruloides TaxID=5286 RepID=A0A2T0A4P4_RHOTO|nr:hypothetical protein AAT19DRAFT_16830 [Rhodotorula toruloides]
MRRRRLKRRLQVRRLAGRDNRYSRPAASASSHEPRCGVSRSQDRQTRPSRAVGLASAAHNASHSLDGRLWRTYTRFNVLQPPIATAMIPPGEVLTPLGSAPSPSLTTSHTRQQASIARRRFLKDRTTISNDHCCLAWHGVSLQCAQACLSATVRLQILRLLRRRFRFRIFRPYRLQRDLQAALRTACARVSCQTSSPRYFLLLLLLRCRRVFHELAPALT